MDAVSWGFIGTVVGAIVGATASIVTTAITTWNTYKISENSKVQDREERARAFQRETLLELQIVMRNYMRASTLAYLADRKNFQESGEWGKYALPDELTGQLLDLNSETSILIQRISNEELRNNLIELKDVVTKSQFANSERTASQYHDACATLYENVNNELGKVLRSSY